MAAGHGAGVGPVEDDGVGDEEVRAAGRGQNQAVVAKAVLREALENPGNGGVALACAVPSSLVLGREVAFQDLGPLV